MKLDWLLLQVDLRISLKNYGQKSPPHTSPASSGSASEIIGEFPERRVVARAPVFFVIYNSTLRCTGFLTLQSYATFFITKMMGILTIYY